MLVGIYSGLDELVWGRGCIFTLDDECQRGAAVILVAFSVPLSVLVIWRAFAAPPNQSWLHAIFGWLIGFFVDALAWFAFFNVAVAVGKAFRLV